MDAGFLLSYGGHCGHVDQWGRISFADWVLLLYGVSLFFRLYRIGNAANVSDKKFRQMIEEALKNKGVKFTVFQEEKLPADFHIADSFPEGNYLKVLFIKIKK